QKDFFMKVVRVFAMLTEFHRVSYPMYWLNMEVAFSSAIYLPIQIEATTLMHEELHPLSDTSEGEPVRKSVRLHVNERRCCVSSSNKSHSSSKSITPLPDPLDDIVQYGNTDKASPK
ncbi:hypothetical protein PV326_011351, partial [Microctonus aethiopoides]